VTPKSRAAQVFYRTAPCRNDAGSPDRTAFVPLSAAGDQDATRFSRSSAGALGPSPGPGITACTMWKWTASCLLYGARDALPCGRRAVRTIRDRLGRRRRGRSVIPSTIEIAYPDDPSSDGRLWRVNFSPRTRSPLYVRQHIPDHRSERMVNERLGSSGLADFVRLEFRPADSQSVRSPCARARSTATSKGRA